MALRFGRSLGSCLLLALLTGLPAGAECTAFSAGDRKEIHRLAERYAEAWRANDRAAVMGVFAPEAVILPDQQPTVSGLAAIEAYYFPAGGSSTTVVSFENSSKELSGCGDLAYDRGEYRLSFRMGGAAEAIASAGEYLALARRQPGGGWRWVLYTWNRLPAAVK